MVAEHGRPRIAGRIVDVLVPLVMEEIVEEINAVPWEQIYERIRKQIVDAYVSQIAEQDTEVPKTPSRDRTLQCAAEQIPNVPVPEMVEQLVEVPETISQDRIQQRTVEQIVDFPVPQVVEELMEVSHVFLQDRVHQRFVEQIIEAPAISLDEQIVEVPVIQTPEKTEQLVNTHVQHVVDTVEVEKPKIIELTVQRKEPIIQEKMNQVTKPMDFPQAQFLNKAGDMPVVVQRQVSTAQKMQKAMEVPPLQFTDKVMNIPVVAQRQIPMDQTVQKTMEIPHLQCVDEVIDVPAEVAVQAPHVHIVGKTVEEPQSQIVENAETPEIQMVRGTETSESLSIAPVCWSTQAEIVEAVEIGALLPAESVVLVPVAVPKKLDSPQVQLIDRVVDISVMAQRHVPSAPRVQKIVEMSKVQFSDGHVDMPVVAQRQVPMIPNVQKTVEVPQIQYIDKIVDAPVVARSEDVSVGTQTVSRKRKHSMETESADGTSDSEHGLVQGEECKLEVDETRERHAAGEDPDLLPVAPNMEAGGSHLQATAEEERIVDWTQDLREIRRMVEFLVRRERKLDVKADVAVKRLARLEKEHSQQEDEECEASLPDALADRTKVVKLVVDKWFVDKGFGFGRVPTGEVVFIHASVVRGAEVLTIGTDAWVQVVHDDARAQGGYRACKAWGRAAWKEERDKERAAKVAEQVRHAAALTAELAAQSEKEVSEVCSHPPGLHDEAAAVTPQPTCSFSLVTSKPLQAGSFRATRPRSNTRDHDNVAMLEETLRLVVEATGKDEASARQQLVNKRPAELLRARDFWRTRVEEKQRFQAKKKEAWEFFRRVPSFKPKSQEEFEEELRRRVMTGYSSSSSKGREKYLDEWMIELQKKALEGDRKLEARERVKMGQEDSSSKRRTEWERIFERSRS